MTEDIWDKKPESEQWGKFKYPVKRGEALKVTVYDAEEMDAWLEKVKVEYDRLQKEGLEHHAIAVEYYEKLEAIKILCEPEADKGVLSTRGRKKLAIDILKILEAEGQ